MSKRPQQHVEPVNRDSTYWDKQQQQTCSIKHSLAGIAHTKRSRQFDTEHFCRYLDT